MRNRPSGMCFRLREARPPRGRRSGIRGCRGAVAGNRFHAADPSCMRLPPHPHERKRRRGITSRFTDRTARDERFSARKRGGKRANSIIYHRLWHNTSGIQAEKEKTSRLAACPMPSAGKRRKRETVRERRSIRSGWFPRSEADMPMRKKLKSPRRNNVFSGGAAPFSHADNNYNPSARRPPSGRDR